jgi:glycosyltransferase involved in cell wall biosynthesis
VNAPLVSCLLATRDAAGTLGTAVASLLEQTVAEIEVVVVDDGSTDETAEVLAGLADSRLVVIRNDASVGLAASLNAGLDRARGRYVARLDADDVALPRRLELQLAMHRRRPGVALSGTSALELDERGAPGRLHEMPAGDAAVRWHLHFSCPFFHPSVLVDRELLDRYRLRYDTSFLESEDYDLWSRLLRVSGGDNLREPLLLKRVHPGQATRRNREVQRSFQRLVALREIAATAPALGEDRGELAWTLGVGEVVPDGRYDEATDAFLELLGAFGGERGAVRARAARQLARAGYSAPAEQRVTIFRSALRLDPALPLATARERARRRRVASAARAEARRWLATLAAPAGPVRVAVVSPEPTPYRAPLFDRIAGRPEVELTVIYAGRTLAGRTWDVETRHHSVFLRGISVPGARRLLRHDYPVTPGVFAALAEADPEVVVVSGWSTFASQAAIAWSRKRRIAYLLLVSSHERGERVGWRRAVRRLVVPRLVRGSAGALVLGTLSGASLVANGVPPERVRVFANTIDVESWEEEANRLRARRGELRARLGVAPEDLVVLSVARLAREKGLDVLVRAVAELGELPVALVVAGSGPERDRLEQLARARGVRVTFTGDVDQGVLRGLYVAADAFALLSFWEPWGVVVNEAAACGLPLVLSDQVGAAPDLLRNGENGVIVPAGDVDAAAAALRRLSDPTFRAAAAVRSRELVAGWGYEPSVAAFVQAVREAAAR